MPISVDGETKSSIVVFAYTFPCSGCSFNGKWTRKLPTTTTSPANLCNWNWNSFTSPRSLNQHEPARQQLIGENRSETWRRDLLAVQTRPLRVKWRFEGGLSMFFFCKEPNTVTVTVKLASNKVIAIGSPSSLCLNFSNISTPFDVGLWWSNSSNQ